MDTIELIKKVIHSLNYFHQTSSYFDNIKLKLISLLKNENGEMWRLYYGFPQER